MTTNTTTVTKRDAERVLAAVKRQCRAYCVDEHGKPSGSQPEILKDWDWTGHGAAKYSIVWEEGPYNWAVNFPYGGIDDEMTSLMQEFRPGAVSRTNDVSDRIPQHVFCEAITGWAVGIYVL